jgi:hypothetical protein
MKIDRLFILLLFAAFPCLAVELKIPIFLKINGQIISAQKANLIYKAQGKNKLPEFYILGLEDIAFQKANYDFWNGIPEKILAFNSRYQIRARMMIETYPGEFNTHELKTCYVGNPHDLLDLYYEATEVNYTEELSIMVIKHEKKYYVDKDFMLEHSSKESAYQFVVKNFVAIPQKLSGDDLFVYVSLNGEYENLLTHRSSFLPKCK